VARRTRNPKDCGLTMCGVDCPFVIIRRRLSCCLAAPCAAKAAKAILTSLKSSEDGQSTSETVVCRSSWMMARSTTVATMKCAN